MNRWVRGELVDADEVPLSVGNSFHSDDLTHISLPKVAQMQGYELVSFTHRGEKRDPVVLWNRWHQIVYEWPDDYVPHWTEVLQVCKQLGIT